MKKTPSIKILVGYHKPAVLLKDDILTPIHLGRALATEASKDGAMSQRDYQWMLDNMIGDDTGDNISKENRKYCELTALYWAWKNYDKLGNPDYIGFMHYRRHFILNEKAKLPKKRYLNQLPTYPSITQRYLKETGLKNITSYFKGEIILPDFIYVNKIYPTITSNIQSFCNYAKIPDFFEEMVKIVSQKKQYKEIAENITRDNKMFSFNMFILPKKYFFQYCSFLFDVCFQLDRHFKDFTSQNTEHLRQIAWTSEFISTIFFEELLQKYSSVRLIPVSYIANTDPLNNLRLLKYKILYKITFGKIRNKYKQKYRKCKGVSL